MHIHVYKYTHPSTQTPTPTHIHKISQISQTRTHTLLQRVAQRPLLRPHLKEPNVPFSLHRHRRLYSRTALRCGRVPFEGWDGGLRLLGSLLLVGLFLVVGGGDVCIWFRLGVGVDASVDWSHKHIFIYIHTWKRHDHGVKNTPQRLNAPVNRGVEGQAQQRRLSCGAVCIYVCVNL